MAGRIISLPPFRGVARTIVLSYLAAFFGLSLLAFALPRHMDSLIGALLLVPASVAHGHVWELLTYSYVPGGVLATAFGLLTVWFTMTTLEEARGRRWVTELFYVTTFGGAALLTVLTLLHLPGLRANVGLAGMWGLVFGLLVVFGALFGDTEFLMFFVFNIKAKYLVMLYVLIDTAILIRGEDTMNVALRWCCGLCAYLFVRFAPVRGFGFATREWVYGLRNQYYRQKRRRAAKKFEVYMRKQNREVHFDADGRYIAPEEDKRDPNDRKWMN